MKEKTTMFLYKVLGPLLYLFLFFIDTDVAHASNIYERISQLSKFEKWGGGILAMFLLVRLLFAIPLKKSSINYAIGKALFKSGDVRAAKCRYVKGLSIDRSRDIGHFLDLAVILERYGMDDIHTLIYDKIQKIDPNYSIPIRKQ